jgi:hypothetical protein
MSYIFNMLICLGMILLDNLLQCLLFVAMIDLSSTCGTAASLICYALGMFLICSWIKIKLKVLIYPTWGWYCCRVGQRHWCWTGGLGKGAGGGGRSGGVGRQQWARSEQWQLGFSFVFRCRVGMTQAKIFRKVARAGPENCNACFSSATNKFGRS